MRRGLKRHVLTKLSELAHLEGIETPMRRGLRRCVLASRCNSATRRSEGIETPMRRGLKHVALYEILNCLCDNEGIETPMRRGLRLSATLTTLDVQQR